MFKKILVKNFQSIASGEVEVGKFSVFTGPSSSGKSAFMRAAEAVTRNSFNPSQVRQGATVAEVSVEVDDHYITAERGKSKSTYMMDDERWAKTGRDVPQKVQNTLKLPLIADVDATFSTQFDKPFLIADPGSAASRVLGSLTNVAVIHTASKEVHRRNMESKSKSKVRESDLNTTEEQLKEYESLSELLNIYEEASTLVENLEIEQYKCTSLQTHIQRCFNIRNQVSDLVVISDAELQALENQIQSIQDLQVQASQLEELLSTISRLTQALESLPPSLDFTLDIEDLEASVGSVVRLRESVTRYESLSNSIPNYDPDVFEYSVQDVEDSLRSTAHLSDVVSSLSRVADSVRKAQENYESLTSQILEMEEEYDILLKELGVCPTCGQSI